MSYESKQWIIWDSRTGQIKKVRAKSRRSLEKRLGWQTYYITIMGTVKSLTRSRRAREELEDVYDK